LKQLKWYYILIAFIVTILILGAGFTYWEKAFNEAPFKEALRAVPAVEEVELEEKDEEVIIVAEVSYHKNLKEVVLDLEQVADEKLKEDYSLKIVDEPNQDMETFREEVNSALYEGARQGNYREIEEYVYRKTGEYSFDHHHFSVDKNRIYLQAQSDDNYIYILVPINSEEGGKDTK